MTITEFLNARYDEEEEAVTRWDIALYEDNQGVPAWIVNARGLVSPDRVLADIAAKRAIVAMHGVETVVYGEPVCTSCGTEADWGHDFEPTHWPCPTLLALAQPFAEHADFDPEWRMG